MLIIAGHGMVFQIIEDKHRVEWHRNIECTDLLTSPCSVAVHLVAGAEYKWEIEEEQVYIPFCRSVPKQRAGHRHLVADFKRMKAEESSQRHFIRDGQRFKVDITELCSSLLEGFLWSCLFKRRPTFSIHTSSKLIKFIKHNVTLILT